MISVFMGRLLDRQISPRQQEYSDSDPFDIDPTPIVILLSGLADSTKFEYNKFRVRLARFDM